MESFFRPTEGTFRLIQFILAANTHTPTHPYKNSPNCFSLEKAWNEGKNVPIYVWNWQSNINNPFGLPAFFCTHTTAPKRTQKFQIHMGSAKKRHTYAHSHTHTLSYSTTSGWLFPFFSALQFISSTRPFILSSMIKVNRREFGEKFDFFFANMIIITLPGKGLLRNLISLSSSMKFALKVLL